MSLQRHRRPSSASRTALPIDVGGPRRRLRRADDPEVADAARGHARVIERSSFSAMFASSRGRRAGCDEPIPRPGRARVEGSLGAAPRVASVLPTGRRPPAPSPPSYAGPGRCLPPTRQRLEQRPCRPVRRARDTPGTVLRGRHRRAGFLDAPAARPCTRGTIRIVGFLIQIQDLFHVRHELGIGLRRVTQYWIFRWVIPFFLASAGWFRADSMIDDPPRQQAQRPVRVALRGRPQTQGDDVSLLLAVEQWGPGGTPAVFAPAPARSLPGIVGECSRRSWCGMKRRRRSSGRSTRARLHRPSREPARGALSHCCR